MKKYKYITLLFAFVFAFGCEHNDESSLPLLQDATWITSIRPTNDYILKAGNAITFADLSQGALSHEYEIEEGNHFIANYKKGDSLLLLVDKNLGTKSTEKTVNVLFLNAGLNKVKLRNTFRDSVTYHAEKPIGAVFTDGVWVIENEWEIDVYGALKPAFKVLDKDGVEIINVAGNDLVSATDSDSWPVLDVESGDEVTFVDLSTEDRPTGRQWSFNEGKPKSSPQETANAAFFKLGTVDAGSMVSIRGDGLPSERVVKLIPLKINVIPSSKPFVFTGGLKEASDQSISFGVSGQLTAFFDQEGSFSVNVKNEKANFDKNIAVKLAAMNPNDATKIDLVLEEPIYNTDIVTISYSGTGIESVDTRSLASFGPEIVSMDSGLNLLSEYFSGFETTTSNWKAAKSKGYWVGNSNGSSGAPVFTRTTDQFASGIASMSYNSGNLPSGKAIPALQCFDFNKMNLPAGTAYQVSLKVYLVEGNTLEKILTKVGTPSTLIEWDVKGLSRGEWHKLSQKVTFSGTTSQTLKGNYRVLMDDASNPPLSVVQKLYLDDLSFADFEERP